MRSRPVGVQPISLLFVAISLRATRGACNPNLQVVITHVLHVRSQHSFGLPLRMNGMHKTQFDLAHLDLLSLVICSRVLICHVKLTQSTALEHYFGPSIIVPLPWVPETFLARFPVSVKSLASPARGFGLRPKMCRPSANTENFLRTREKSLVPRVLSPALPNLW